jgi:hypothetical protein
VRNTFWFLIISVLSFGVACGGGPHPAASRPEFSAGIAHVSGNYGFTQDNYLVEGATRIQQLGSSSIFIYLTPWFRSQYPDHSAALWPASDPAGVDQLAQTAPYDQVFAMPFKTIVLSTYTFANADQIQGMAASPARQSAEEDEFYALTKYLYAHFSGSGKTFVLKNWEGDWIGLGYGNQGGSIAPGMVQDLIAWLSSRQRGVSRARGEAHDSSVQVFNAVEVNRVLDYAEQGLTRVINAVVPEVHADMVTYSSYDSTAVASDAAWLKANLTLAIQTIDQLAPDPLALGRRRILISEYGLFENQFPGQAVWRAQAILQTAHDLGLSGAFIWNLYDNQCVEANAQPAPIDSESGDPLRPTDQQCRGLWIVRPDGTTSSALAVLKTYW